MTICLTQDEEFRLQALNSYGILDTQAERDYDDITRLAAAICNAPTALVSFVDDARQWFKSRVGLDVSETPRDIAFCAHAILNPSELFIVEDATQDERFRENPLVTNAPYVRFYAGAPLVTPDGFALGSLCVIDYVPRKLSADQQESLKALARQVVAHLELRRTAQINSELSNRYRQIFSQASDGIHLFDFNRRILRVNEKFCEITGRTEAELLTMRIEELILPEDLGPIPLEELHSGRTRVIQTRFLRPDGTCRTVEVSSKKLDDNTIQGIVRDLSERKRIEKKLAQSEEKLRKTQDNFDLFVDNSPTVIFIKDEEGKYVTVNHSFEELFRIKREDLRGKNDFQFLPPEVAESVIANDRKVLETGETLKTVEFVPSADGTPHYWLSHKFLIKDADGKKLVGGTAVNITERKQMEDELAAARDAALESARMKSAFLANVSHEIRTPMNGVIGVTELLLNTPLDRTQRDYAEMILQSADDLLAVINDILDLSKIESGRLRFDVQDFDVRETIESTVEQFAERAQRKNIELASFVEPNIPPILRGDAGRLRQVLINLVGNAVKFTERGGVKLEVKTESETADNLTLRFDVTDSGSGIKKSDLSKLFQPFVQIDNSMTRRHGGTGLGLVISKQIVEMMNGEIKVESDFGTGSRFSFTANFAKAENSASAEKSPTLSDSLAGKRVLIINAAPIIRETLRQYIGAWKMSVAEMETSENALDVLKHAADTKNPFDVILIDNDSHGFALAEQIKNEASLPAARTILISDYGQSSDAAQAEKTGVAGFLAKPVRGEKLFECLTAVLKENAESSIHDSVIPSKSAPKASVKPEKAPEKNAVAVNVERNLKLLIVEDNEVNRAVVTRQLERIGIKADVAINGQEAVEKTAANDYQIILMDCQMPVLDGYQAAQEIRRREQEKKERGEFYSPVAIIALTAHTFAGEREKCLAAGMNDYLSKPARIKELTAIIDAWC